MPKLCLKRDINILVFAEKSELHWADNFYRATLCYAVALCLSVRLFLTSRYHFTKMAKRRIMQRTPHNRAGTILF